MGIRRCDIEYYKELSRTAAILPEWSSRVTYAVNKIEAGQIRYSGFSIPWYYVGLLHWMEAGCDFDRQLLNGQRWNRRTSIAPIGLGPWDSWESSTRFAIECSTDENPIRDIVSAMRDSGDIEKILYCFERWNGMGYRRVRRNGSDAIGVHSPYLWSGTNHGIGAGKYVQDGKYDAAAVSDQVGVAPLLKKLLERQGNKH